MKKISQTTRYTTEAAWAYATKKLEHVSFEDPNDRNLRAMCSKKVKVVIKMFEIEDE